MLTLTQWRSGTAFFMALGMATTATLPMLMASPATAGSEVYQISQLLEQRITYRLPAGTAIPVRYEAAERIILKPEESVDVTLTVATDVRSGDRGWVVLPAGSKIEGQLRPSQGGTQFISENVILANRDQALPINATSDVITDTQIINERSSPDIVRGAAIGGAAAAVLSEIFGSIDFLEVLAGAGIGVLAEVLIRNDKEVEVVVVEPETDLDLTLQSEFVRN
jgi:hypothetical protein